MRRLIALATVTAALTIPTVDAAEQRSSYPLADSVAIARTAAHTTRLLTWQCQRRLGEPRIRSVRFEKRTRSLAAIGWVNRTWDKRLAACLRRERHRALPHVNDWRTAASVAQRAYPGTYDWLMSCSASEGGHGRWVANRQGSGASGWLQFMHSTFVRMFDAAEDDVTGRGFVVPEQANSWYSPLGQALAGAWGVTHGRSHEWSGSGC